MVWYLVHFRVEYHWVPVLDLLDLFKLWCFLDTRSPLQRMMTTILKFKLRQIPRRVVNGLEQERNESPYHTWNPHGTFNTTEQKEINEEEDRVAHSNKFEVDTYGGLDQVEGRVFISKQ
jgi:hypothetical protein